MLAMLVLIAACSGQSVTEETFLPSTTAPSTTIHLDDGLFIVGLVVPTSGPGAEIGAAVESAVRLAAAQINDAGGIRGQEVRIVPRDEGETTASAEVAVNELIDLGADVLIGPTSSINVLATLETAVDHGVLTCSPTASSLALDAFPDRGLFFRTMPSDSLQAIGLAEVVDDAGGSRTALAYLDDPYGRPFGERVERALDLKGIGLAASVAVTPDQSSIDAAVATITAERADVVVVVGDPATGGDLIAQIDAASTFPRPEYVVNDALRRPELSGLAFDAEVAQHITGISPLSVASDTAFANALRELDPDSRRVFAHNGYDCLNVIALAATTVASVRGPDIADAVYIVTNGGTSCRSFQQCSALLEVGRNIDYDGPSGEMSLNTNGDLANAIFEQFGFADGRDYTTRTFVVGND